ncbi:MAG: 3-dehydroquinate synthase [Balneolaceae bacterium]
MLSIDQSFSVSYHYKVLFTQSVFSAENSLLADVIQPDKDSDPKKILFVIDQGLLDHYPHLNINIRDYASKFQSQLDLIPNPVIIPGGEASKNNSSHVDNILKRINSGKLDRHSFVAAIGGGAVIDTAGYAAAIAHRGVRMIRIPTTVLAQNDASVGVKNGINLFGKKNFLGTFAPPHAVINDSDFLTTLDQRDWVSGISEAIKVALLKNGKFFHFIGENAEALRNRDSKPMDKLIYECAKLHLEHISTSGDPFERGSSRPLDFGHWAAHKLEQLTDYELRHGEAVAIGIALDVTYSYLKGMLEKNEWEYILNTLKQCGFKLFVPELQLNLDSPLSEGSLFYGLQEFREHLGGQLTIMLLEGIGNGVEVHEVDFELYKKAVGILKEMEKELVN